MIHFDKNSFLKLKEEYLKLVEFLQREDHPELKIRDKGVRFTISRPGVQIDFDYGNLNMRKREFGGYTHVISTGRFTICGDEIQPGDLAFPSRLDPMRINTGGTKLTVLDQSLFFTNPMEGLFQDLAAYENQVDQKLLKDFVIQELGVENNLPLSPVEKMRVLHNARFVECNLPFTPETVNKTRKYLKSQGHLSEIAKFGDYLCKRFDGLNTECRQMVEALDQPSWAPEQARLYMFSIGGEKPYQEVQMSEEEQTQKTAQTNYFISLLFRYLLSDDFAAA